MDINQIITQVCIYNSKCKEGNAQSDPKNSEGEIREGAFTNGSLFSHLNVTPHRLVNWLAMGSYSKLGGKRALLLKTLVLTPTGSSLWE